MRSLSHLMLETTLQTAACCQISDVSNRLQTYLKKQRLVECLTAPKSKPAHDEKADTVDDYDQHAHSRVPERRERRIMFTTP